MAVTVNEPPIRTLVAVNNTNRNNGRRIVPRRRPVYPISAERELARDFLTVTKNIQTKARPYLERIFAIYDAWAQENIRLDARISMQEAIGIILGEYGDDIHKDIDVAELTKRVNRTAKYARGISIRDWKALVNNALNLDVDEPFYVESTEDLINKWVYESVQNITSYPEAYLGKVQEAIIWGYTTKQPMVNVYRRIQKLTNDTPSHAKMIARDQMGTLNYQLTRHEHESIGVSQYKWITKRDARVRDCHRELHGHIFDWNNPPAQWYLTKSRGVVYTGFAHPGQAYGCRCVAQPVFDEKAVESFIARPIERPR